MYLMNLCKLTKSILFIALCPECDGGSQCEICSGDSCTQDSMCTDNSTTLCYFEKCCGRDKIVRGVCGMCEGRRDMVTMCSDDCHCSVCCHVCTATEVQSALATACRK